MKEEHSKGGSEMLNVLTRLQKIEAKEKCLRVQFLDWLSDTLLNWSNRAHVMACKINSPCLIEVVPRKREDSKHAKENKELTLLRELLADERAAYDRLRNERSEIASRMLKEFEELQKGKGK